MSPQFLKLLFCLALSVSTGRAQAHAVAVPTIDFSARRDLLALYQAGVSPWRGSQADGGMLFVNEERLGLIFPGASRVELEVSIGTFQVLAENQIGTVDLISQPMTLEEAHALTRQLCHAFDVSTQGLDEFTDYFREISSHPEKAVRDHPGTWKQFNIQRAGARYGIAFQAIRGWNRTFAKVNLSARFYEVGKPMRFLTEPVKQPPGFEHVSMERDKNKPSRLPSWMKAIAGRNSEQGLEVSGSTTVNHTQDSAAQSALTPPIASSPESPKPRSSN